MIEHDREPDTSRNTPQSHDKHSLDPRFRHSDYNPSDVERYELIEIHKQCREELGIIEQEPVALEEQKRSLEITAGMCLSALSSQRRVPNEVWEIIFTTLCTTLHDYSFKLDYYYGISNQTYTYKTILLEIPSLVLTHVCSRWRGIAMSLPHLWSSLSIKFNELPFDITVPLELYLSRSQESPLSIRITRLAQYPLCGLSEVGLAAWQKLASGFRRCKNLTLAVSFFDLPRLEDLSFPQLEKVYEEPFQVDTVQWFWGSMMASPKLKAVSLHYFRDFLPFARLKGLELRILHPREHQLLLAALPSCHSLEALTLTSMYHFVNMPPLVREVEVPSLRKLSLGMKRCDKDISCLVGLLSSLSLPSLDSFELSCGRGWPVQLLTLAARAPLLTSLNLSIHFEDKDRESWSSDRFTPLLHSCSFPSLTHLELYVSDPGTDRRAFGDNVLSSILSDLRLRPDSSVPLSGLEHVHLHVSQLSLNHECVDQVLGVVSERHSASPALTWLRVSRDSSQVEEGGGREVDASSRVERENSRN
ncbi:hypothetical protein PM082_021711 [Marasmius tenuissimus]|nr:hypothetical protein PM082_021711 [Marasmius tenuissimus]